jgi:hypothetical protein
MPLSDFWHRLDAALIVLSFLVSLLLIADLGYHAGLKRLTRPGERKSELVQQGLLTLLAMLLAFGVSMADSRYEERNSILIEEAASIGTTHLRAAFFPRDFQIRFDSLLKQYLDSRIEWYQLKIDRPKLEKNRRKTMDLQSALWKEAAELGQVKPTITMSLLFASLNQTIDLQLKQEFAYTRRIPHSIIMLLFLITFLVTGLVGYSHGTLGSRHFYLTTMMSVVLAMTLFVILDLSRAERGLITLNPQVLIDLRQSLEGV